MSRDLRESFLFVIALLALALSGFNTYRAESSGPKQLAISINHGYYTSPALMELKHNYSRYRENYVNGLPIKDIEYIANQQFYSYLESIAKLVNDGLVDNDYIAKDVRCEIYDATTNFVGSSGAPSLNMDEALKYVASYVDLPGDQSVCGDRMKWREQQLRDYRTRNPSGSLPN